MCSAAGQGNYRFNIKLTGNSMPIPQTGTQVVSINIDCATQV
jgi:hypothetical protein